MKMKEESEKAGLKLSIQKIKIMASGPIFIANRRGNSDRLYLYKITVNGDCSSWTFAPWKKSYDIPRQCIKKQRHFFSDKGLSSQSYGFSSSNVWM